jgi:hypothetical protein
MFELKIGGNATGGSGGDFLEYAKVFADVVGHVAWPVAMAFILVMYRQEITGLIRRVKSMTGPGGFAFTVSDQLEQAQDIIETSPEILETPPVDIPVDDPFLMLADKFPERAIEKSWTELEKVVRSLPHGTALSMREYIQVLRKLRLVSADIQSLFSQLSKTRYFTTKSDDPVTTEEALQYNRQIKSLIDALLSHRQAIEMADSEVQHAVSERQLRPVDRVPASGVAG